MTDDQFVREQGSVSQTRTCTDKMCEADAEFALWIDEEVLVSSGDRDRQRGPKRFHRRLGETHFSVCSRLEPQNDPVVVSREKAEDQDLKPCSLCPFPDEVEKPLIADGGER